jgi:hypothetical protein
MLHAQSIILLDMIIPKISDKFGKVCSFSSCSFLQPRDSVVSFRASGPRQYDQKKAHYSHFIRRRMCEWLVLAFRYCICGVMDMRERGMTWTRSASCGEEYLPCPCRESNPGCSARSQSFYRLSLGLIRNCFNKRT